VAQKVPERTGQGMRDRVTIQDLAVLRRLHRPSLWRRFLRLFTHRRVKLVSHRSERAFYLMQNRTIEERPKTVETQGHTWIERNWWKRWTE
jgi:hypothetical protein